MPRTRDALSVIVENVRIALDCLPVPLALENVAALFGWPGDELTEAQFLGELVERTGVKLLIDVANLYTNQINLGLDAVKALDALPLEHVAYVHVAGGHGHGDVWHDTHTASPPDEVLDLLAELCARHRAAGRAAGVGRRLSQRRGPGNRARPDQSGDEPWADRRRRLAVAGLLVRPAVVGAARRG